MVRGIIRERQGSAGQSERPAMKIYRRIIETWYLAYALSAALIILGLLFGFLAVR